MISNNGNKSHIQLNNLKNKIFYLDTNVIFRILGINGQNRQNRTFTVLRKFAEVNTQLVISKFSEIEFKDTITFYLDKINRTPIHRKLNPDIFNEKYFNKSTDIYDFYYKWRTGKANDSIELFEGYILNLYEKFKIDYKIITDYKIPFDEKDEKTEKQIKELASSISTYKNNDGASHGINADSIDALNVLLVESRRDGKNINIFETKHFIISTDQSLRRWDYYRNTLTPIIVLPSQWLSILLRYINRSNDDFKSFVSFLNLPSGESQIDSEKIHIILAGISEMTENFEQQQLIVQSLVQKKFEGILEKGVNDEEILERTKSFAKLQLQRQIEEIVVKHDELKSEFDSHKATTSINIQTLEKKANEQAIEIAAKKIEVTELKVELKNKFVKENILVWRRSVFFLIPLGLIIIVFTILQFCFKDYPYNYSYKLIETIDSLGSDSQKGTLRALLYAPLVGLWLIITYCFKRLTNSDLKKEKEKEFESLFDKTNS